MDLERIEKAYAEWSYIQYEMDRLMGSDYGVCEACGPKPHCIHIDGNFKLYRYRSAGDAGTDTAYHLGNLIEEQAAVTAHVAKLDTIKKVGCV